ncbi:MAG: bacteriohemerythrin [Gammaproteobacteria bacterium]|nr:bacteriohemerythrin [Gammaproteobacteria bacterium]
MQSIHWNADLEIGISVIDGQHRRIVDYINALHAIGDRGDRRVVGAVLHDLVDYTYSHFAFEEALMEEADYPLLAVHQETHVAFRDRVDGLQRRFDSGDEVVGELAELLKTWLLGHIAEDDRSYADLVREKLPRIERRQRGGWLGNAVQRFFGH